MRAILLGLAFLLCGQTAWANSEPRVAYVNMARALNDVEEGKAAKAKLKKDFEGKQVQLDKMQRDLKKKKEQFEKRQAMMKPDVRQAKAEELQRSFVQMQQTYMTLQRELMDSEGKIAQNINQKLRRVIEKIGDRDAYAMILDLGDTVLYHKRHLNITDDVVRAYNKQYVKK